MTFLIVKMPGFLEIGSQKETVKGALLSTTEIIFKSGSCEMQHALLTAITCQDLLNTLAYIANYLRMQDI